MQTLTPSKTSASPTQLTASKKTNNEASVLEKSSDFNSVLKNQVKSHDAEKPIEPHEQVKNSGNTQSKKEIKGQKENVKLATVERPAPDQTNAPDGSSISKATNETSPKDNDDEKGKPNDADQLILMINSLSTNPAQPSDYSQSPGEYSPGAEGSKNLPIASEKSSPGASVDPDLLGGTGKTDGLKSSSSEIISTQISPTFEESLKKASTEQLNDDGQQKLQQNEINKVEPDASNLNPGASQLILPTQQASTGTQSEKIHTHISSEQWGQDVAQKVVWMVKNDESSATLTINPPDLGPMKVVVHVENGQAHASFSSDQPEVRQALLDAMPKLRESMQEAGIAFGQANVSSGTGSGNNQDKGTDSRYSAPSTNKDDNAKIVAGGAIIARPISRAHLGLVDTFA